MMEPEEIRRLIKRIVFIGLFFALALALYLFGRGGDPAWRRLLVTYGVIVALVMVLAILLQSGRGGGLASLGGLAGDTLLGARSATPIAKATYVMGALFLFIFMLTARLASETAQAPGGVIPRRERPPLEQPLPEGAVPGGSETEPVAPAGGAEEGAAPTETTPAETTPVDTTPADTTPADEAAPEKPE